MKVRIALGAVVALLLALYAGYAPFRNAVDHRVEAVRDSVNDTITSHYSPVRPVKITSATAAGKHTADKIADQYTNTFWAAPYDSKAKAAKPSKVVFEFDKRVILNQVIVTPGAVGDPAGHGRPQNITLSFDTETGINLTLQDSTKPQTFPLKKAVGVKKVTLSVNKAFVSDATADVAVSEIEFFSLIS
ncbi:NADase-type glycan-binding domain-containing protein [Streptomyces chartreusis]